MAPKQTTQEQPNPKSTSSDYRAMAPYWKMVGTILHGVDALRSVLQERYHQTWVGVILCFFIGFWLVMPAYAVECQIKPSEKGYWGWRYVEPRAKTRCWYQGRHVLPKSQLHWRAPAENKPLITDEIKNHRAELLPTADANGADLTPYTEVMEKPQPADNCCWPPLDERSFKSRWDELPMQWLTIDHN